MQKERYHHGDLRAALVREAITALEGTGALPSWRALARACGVSQSAPYRHFDGLEGLRAAVAAEGFRRLGKQIRAATLSDDPPLERFEAGFRAYVHFGAKHGSLYALMFEQRPDGGELAGASADAYSTLLSILAELGVHEPLRAAFALWTAHHGLVDILQHGILPDGVPKQADALADLVLAMMKAYLTDQLERQRE